jgi:regulatory protein
MAGRRGGQRSRGAPGAPAAPSAGQRADGQSAERGSGRASNGRARGYRADSASAYGRAPSEGGIAPTGPDGDPEAIARQICLRLLSAAPRTCAELAAALQRRGVPEDAAAAVLARFAEVKLIDDELFARAWVESRHHGRGLAGRALGAELRQRGVTSAEIEAALEQLSPDQEIATARELVERRLSGTTGLPPAARMRRLTGVLARKGYSPRLAYRVVREALEQEAGTDPVRSYDYEIFPEPDEDEAPADA